MLPDLEAWAIFATVAQAGSFSRAAAELGLSKATVSKALTRLELRLGAPLFHRSSRRLSLTQAGHTVLARAQRLLAEGAAAEAEICERQPQPAGLVRMTAPVSFGIQRLGPLLPGFLARYPLVSLDLSLTDRRVDLVAEGIDLALRIGVLADSALRARRVAESRRVLVAAPAYLAREGTPAHPRALEGRPAVLFTQLANPTLWQFHHAAEGEVTVRMRGRLHTDNGDVILPALLGGAVLALMPEFLVAEALQAGQLVVLLPGWEVAAAGIHIVTAPSTVRPARVTALVEFLAEALG